MDKQRYQWSRNCQTQRVYTANKGNGRSRIKSEEDNKSGAYVILANDWPPQNSNRENEMRGRRGQKTQASVLGKMFGEENYCWDIRIYLSLVFNINFFVTYFCNHQKF